MKPVYLGSLVLAVFIFSCLQTPGVCGWNEQLWSTYCSGDNCSGLVRATGGVEATISDLGSEDCCEDSTQSPSRGTCQDGACGPRAGGYGCNCPNCGVAGVTNPYGCPRCGWPRAAGFGMNRQMCRPNGNANVCQDGTYICQDGTYGGAHGVLRRAPYAAVKAACRPVAGCIRSTHSHCANGCCGGAVGPEYGAVTYPYYTTRGPRDFFLTNPATIGP